MNTNGDNVKDDLEVILSRGLAQYKDNIMDKTLRQLQRSMELALRMEWILNHNQQHNDKLFLSKDWEHRIQQIGSRRPAMIFPKLRRGMLCTRYVRRSSSQLWTLKLARAI